MAHKVLDLSSYQHPQTGTNPDGTAVYAEIDYKQVYDALVEGDDKPLIIVKTTELSPGGLYVNPFAERDLNGFRDVGCKVAAYLFFHPAVDVDAQVRAAKEHAYGVDFYLVDSETVDELPVEQTGQATHDCLTALSWHLFNTGLYADLSNVESWAGAPWGHALGLAEYGTEGPSIECTFWQNGDLTPVPGIQGAVDHDVWEGKIRDWDSLFPAPKPEPVPEPEHHEPPFPEPEQDVKYPYPQPDGDKGDWAIAEVPTQGTYLVNLFELLKHTFASGDDIGTLLGEYRRHHFPQVYISAKLVQDLKEV
jgi:hypothetical protein